MFRAGQVDKGLLSFLADTPNKRDADGEWSVSFGRTGEWIEMGSEVELMLMNNLKNLIGQFLRKYGI